MTDTRRKTHTRPNYGATERKKQGIRGHDAALNFFQRSAEPVMAILNSPIILANDVEQRSIVGVLTQYDAYTITLEVESMSNPLIIFKSSIFGLTKAQ